VWLFRSLDECTLNPCFLTRTTPPAEIQEWPSVFRATQPSSVFACPTSIVCSDPDTMVTDDYICTCPACSSVVFSNITAALMGDYFQAHPGFTQHLIGQIEAQKTGTDVCSANAAPAVPMVYGCNDPLAINFNPRANAYDNTGALGEQCRAVRCGSPTGPLPTCPSGASPAWKGPSGGVCYRFVGTVEETVPWSCGQMQGMDIPMVEYGDCASCVRLDECASNTVSIAS
jgi:hypothetical protein